MENYTKLKKIFETHAHIRYAKRLLIWDEMAMMPEGAGSHRAKTIAIFDQLMHQMLTSKKVQSALKRAQSEDLTTLWDQKNLAWMQKKHQLLHSIPSQLSAQSAQANTLALQAWRKYRAENNWKDFCPFLEKSFHYVKAIAEIKSQALQMSPYDALMNDFAPGSHEKEIDPLITQLKSKILPLRAALMQQQDRDTVMPLQGDFPIEKQKTLVVEVGKLLGFNFQQGRIDTSHHPMCDGAPIDVRITTRYNVHNPLEALMGAIHEIGHGLYEQGMPTEWIWQPVGQIQDKSLHESQALLFEYHVGHSLPFLQTVSTKLRQHFGDHPALSPENLFQQLHHIRHHPIRIDADAVSQVLHNSMRYEIEKGLLANTLTIRDLPEAWNTHFQDLFGMALENNYKEGVMQDIHWPLGYFGYFPSYVTGQLMAAQLYATFLKATPEFYQELQKGNVGSLKAWLTEKVYAHASTLTATELLTTVTGEPLNAEFFIKHISQPSSWQRSNTLSAS